MDEIAIVPSRRTRDPEDVDISWELDAYKFDLPLMASAMDSVVSPASAVSIGKLGGCGVLNLEGLWTRYEDPSRIYEEIAKAPPEKATLKMQEVYAAESVKKDLIIQRINEMKSGGITAAAAITPQAVDKFMDTILEAELDLLVIQGTVVTAEHQSSNVEPLNLKETVRKLPMPVVVGGCASADGALHLMRTGAAAVLVGVGPGQACTTRGVLGIGVPQATAIADVRQARVRHLDETGVYVHIIADGGLSTGGHIAKAVACGADAVMIGSPLASANEAPGRGFHWGMASYHQSLPRGTRIQIQPLGTLEEILTGPAAENNGKLNLFGALKTSMATCGYETLKEFQNAEVIVAPSHTSEGKDFQREQSIGMG